MPKVSVIIPVYGTPDRLRRTIQSVLDQTMKDFELIVVDDNQPGTQSRRQTAVLMQRFLQIDKRIKYILHEQNKNGSAARNTGIRIAKGKYISFLDSDDAYRPDRLSVCVNALENCSNVKVQGVYTGCEYRRGNRHYRMMKTVKSGNFLGDYLKLNFNLFTGSNIFLTKSAVDRLNGFDETFLRHQDMEFMIRFFQHYDIIGIPKDLLIKNLDEKNRPSAQKLAAIKKHFFEVFHDIINAFPVEERNQIFAAHYRQLAEQFLLEGKYTQAVFYYKKVQELHCLTLKYIMRGSLYFLRSIRKRTHCFRKKCKEGYR